MDNFEIADSIFTATISSLPLTMQARLQKRWHQMKARKLKKLAKDKP